MRATGGFNTGKQGQTERNGLLKYAATQSPTAIYSLLLQLTQDPYRAFFSGMCLYYLSLKVDACLDVYSLHGF